MSKLDLNARHAASRFTINPRWWVWGAVLGSVLVCAAIIWIHMQQSQAVTRTTLLVDHFRRARVDLTKGFLHISLSSTQGSPYSREQGIALIQQAIADMRRIDVDEHETTQISRARAATLEDFETSSKQFLRKLQELRAEIGINAQAETQLRLAFYELEQQADKLDKLNQADLHELSKRLGQRLTAALILAALLLTGICCAVHLAGRQHIHFISAIRASEDRLQTVIENIAEGIVIASMDGRTVHWNRAAIAMHGLSAEDNLNTKLEEFTETFELCLMDGTALSFEQWPLLRIFRGETVYNEEYILRRIDQAWQRVFSYNGAIMHDSENLMLAFLSITDVTQSRLAEAALREEKDRLSKLAATSPSAMHSFRITPAGGISFPYASPRVREIYGFSPQALEADASAITACWHPDDAQRLWAGIEESRRSMTLWHDAFRVQHPIQGEIWVETHSMPVREPDGSVTWHGSLTDVTERKQLEEQLRQSQKMDAIGQLASGVAHDFNNLLTVIQGNASLMSEIGPADLNEYAAAIVDASERATSLTRQLLLFSRRQVIQPVDLDLNHVVRNMTRMLQRLLGEHIELKETLAEDLPHIRADAGMLEQVLLNLAVNARDAMPSGGLLHVSTRPQTHQELEARRRVNSEAPPCVCLRVDDMGCGIAPEIIPRIFEPFFTTKEVGKGTGLGLATVYGIIKQHGGSISVSSHMGEGTTFTIELPISLKAASAEENLTPVTPMPRGHETILVVEDEASVRKLVALQLERCGYRVLTAISGTHALEVWKEHRSEVDLLLTDMVMPDSMSGAELAQRLLEDCPGLRVIYTSGYSPELAGKGIALIEGINFLQKPYLPGKLAESVRHTLDRPPATA